MKAAVLGSTSFLAGYVIRMLKTVAHDVTEFSRTGTEIFSYPDRLPSTEQLAQFDLIVLTASAGVQAGNAVKTVDLIGVNLFYPVALITELTERNFKGVVITFGSYFEIGNCSDDRVFDEQALVHTTYPATNPYSTSKRLLTRFRDSYASAMRWYHIVLPTIYGKGERPARFIPYLIDAARGQKDLKVTAGNQVRQYLHADDVCTFVNMIISSQITPDIYNLAPAESMTIADLRTLTIKTANPDYKGNIAITAGRDEQMKILKLDALKANSHGWKPKVSLEKGIRSYLS